MQGLTRLCSRSRYHALALFPFSQGAIYLSGTRENTISATLPLEINFSQVLPKTPSAAATLGGHSYPKAEVLLIILMSTK